MDTRDNILNSAIELLACPNCGGSFILLKNEISCVKCEHKAALIDGIIFQFQKASLPEDILEKTMYGPEYEELKNEINEYSDPNLLKKFNLIKKEDCICLDYGCGSSRQVFDLVKNFKAKIVFGLDYDLEPLRISAKITKELKLSNIFFIQFSSDNIPFKNNVFDIITSHQALEHVNNPENVIENISAKMKEGASIEIDFPNGGSLGEYMREKFHKLTKKKNPHISKINLLRARKTFQKNNLSEIVFVPTQVILGPMIYIFEGFILRFIFKKYKNWSIRKSYDNFLFNIIRKIEKVIMKTFPKSAHDFRFVLTKK